jgi:hypothetical protein
MRNPKIWQHPMPRVRPLLALAVFALTAVAAAANLTGTEKKEGLALGKDNALHPIIRRSETAFGRIANSRLRWSHGRYWSLSSFRP